jgi:tRNA threonylcarbamoyladenosine biosynthesis protein TsaB
VILAIRTDKPEAEISLYNNKNKIDTVVWHAHRELSNTILLKIDELLSANNVKKNELTGICIYEGPGSFTGLRIGFGIANALSYALNIPVAAAAGDNWIADSLSNLINQAGYSQSVFPEYGGQAHITQPRK